MTLEQKKQEFMEKFGGWLRMEFADLTNRDRDVVEVGAAAVESAMWAWIEELVREERGEFKEFFELYKKLVPSQYLPRREGMHITEFDKLNDRYHYLLNKFFVD